MLTSEIVHLILPALCAGLLVVVTHVPLGHYVLQRGIIFIDLAIAQIAALGFIVAHMLHMDTIWQQQLTALFFSLLGAYCLHYYERKTHKHLEAVIGLSYILATTAAILLLATDPHGAEHFKHLLAGQILWVHYGQLLWVAVLYSLVLLLWYVSSIEKRSLMFYLLFAIVVSTSVQLVGVFLVFATLIIPALAVYECRQYRLLLGYIIGCLGYVLGLFASISLDLPAGAMIVWSLLLSAILINCSLRISQRVR